MRSSNRISDQAARWALADGYGAREIDDSLLSRMAKQCKLSNRDFGLLIECPLDRDSYEAKLIAQGAVDALPA